LDQWGRPKKKMASPIDVMPDDMQVRPVLQGVRWRVQWGVFDREARWKLQIVLCVVCFGWVGGATLFRIRSVWPASPISIMPDDMQVATPVSRV
jgi:hypothetical protein